MDSKDSKRKLTLMMVPHSGKRIKAIELTFPFFLSAGIIITLIVCSSVFLTYKYINAKVTLRRNIEYISERESTLAQIEEDIKQTSEVTSRFNQELEKSQYLFQNVSYSEADSNNELQQGDFSQVLDISSNDYENYEFTEVVNLVSLSQKLQDSLPILENMNKLMSNQQDLLKDLPVFWPVKGANVTMEWGPNIHPITGTWYIHKGIDLAAVNGTPVQVSGNGEVTFVGYDIGYGLHVYVSHKYGFKTHYAHLSAIRVKKGQKVSQGDIIGKVGSTGLVTGSHLHLEYYLGNELLDPGVYLRMQNDYVRPQGNR